MLTFDQKTGRLIRRVVGMKGMNTLKPRRIGEGGLQEGEATYTLNVRVRSGHVVPSKEAGDEAYTAHPDEVVKHMFEAEFATPRLISLGTTKAWAQESGDPVVKTPSPAFSTPTTSYPLWQGFTMLQKASPVAVVNNSGVNEPHYLDPNERTLSYDTGDDGTGDVPDVGDTVEGASGSVGTIMAITTASGVWASGTAAGVLTLRLCTGDWANNEVLTFEDGETALAADASAERPFIKLANAPNMRAMIGWLGCLFGGDVNEGSGFLANRIRWSDAGDITTWTGATSGYYDLIDEADPIRTFALMRGNLLLVLRRKSAYLGSPTGDAGDPIRCARFAGRGILAPCSLQVLEQEYLFLGEDDIYSCGMSGLGRVGSRVRTDLFRDADESKLEYSWSFLDQRTKEYYLITEMLDGTLRAWIFNYEDRQWATQTVTGYTALAIWRED